jgi:perosamine synthetase
MGYNYRLSDINCAMGIAQMKRIDEILEKRRQVAEWYISELQSVDEIQIQKSSSNCKKSWFVFVIQLNKRYNIKDRNDILHHLRKAGVACSDYFSPIHLQPFMVEKFGFKQGDFPNCEKISSRTIALPFYSNLSKSKISFVVDKLKGILLKY